MRVLGRGLGSREVEVDLEQPANVRRARIVKRDVAVVHARQYRRERASQWLATVTLDITTLGVGMPSLGGLVGSEPIFSTTPMPETTLPATA